MHVKIVQSENRRFTLSFLTNWKLYRMTESTERPPPTHTHTTSDVSIFESGGGISRGIPRKCSPLAQIRREQKKHGPLLLVYFMVLGMSRRTVFYHWDLFLLHLSSILTALYCTVFNFGTGTSVSVSDCASANASSSVGDPNSKLKKYC